MRKQTVAVIAVAVVVLLLGIAWAFRWMGGEDAEVAEVRAQFENREQFSDADRQAMRERIGGLDESQRRQLFEPMRARFETTMRTTLTRLRSLNEAARRDELDTWIDAMENRSRQRQANRGGGPPERFANMTQAERDALRKGMLDRTTPEMRATMDQLMTMVNDRRSERGLDRISSPRALMGGLRRRG